MKLNFIKAPLLVALCFSSFANAADECTSNLTGFDTCKYARELVDELATQLPMRMSQNLLLEKAMAFKSLVSLHAILGYNEEFLETTVQQNGVSMDKITQTMKVSTKANLCQEKSTTEAFISLGGKIQYIYKFSDGMPYLTVNVDSCN